MSFGECPFGGQWYTCTDQTPTFTGCCASDPCGGDGTGCPDGQLYPSAAAAASSTITSSTTARSTTKSQSRSRSTITASSAPTSLITTISSSSPSSTADPSSSSTSSPTSSSTSSPTPVPSTGLSKTQVRAIAGGSAGAGVFLFLLIAICLTWHRQKKSRLAHRSQPPLRKAPSFPPELCGPQPQPQIQPTPRAPLPYLQTDLEKFQARQRIHSTYSAYSPDHITPSSFDSHQSALSVEKSLVPSARQMEVRRASDEGYYPGRPVFGVPHVLKVPEPIAQSGRGARSVSSPASVGPSPPPSYKSQPHSPVSPIAGNRRASYNYSYPSVPTAAVGARSGERRGSAQFEQSRRPIMRQVRSEGAMGYEPRRRSETATQPIHETTEPAQDQDRVTELPESPTNTDYRRRERRQPVGAPNLRVRTVSTPSTALGSNPWTGTPTPVATVESINAGGSGWGGDMRTDRERQRDEMERRMQVESQSKARYSYASQQSLSP